MKEVSDKLNYDIPLPKLSLDDDISVTNQIIKFIKQHACNGDKTLIKRNQKVIDFLKVKEKLILNYCMYLNYYILGQNKMLNNPDKVVNLQENEVLKKLTYYRTLIKSIEPIDQQVMKKPIFLIFYRFMISLNK